MNARVPTQSPSADAPCPQKRRRKSLMWKTSLKPEREIPAVGLLGGGGGCSIAGSGTGGLGPRPAPVCGGIEVAPRAAFILDLASRKGSPTSTEMYPRGLVVPGGGI